MILWPSCSPVSSSSCSCCFMFLSTAYPLSMFLVAFPVPVPVPVLAPVVVALLQLPASCFFLLASCVSLRLLTPFFSSSSSSSCCSSSTFLFRPHQRGNRRVVEKINRIVKLAPVQTKERKYPKHKPELFKEPEKHPPNP